MSSGELDELRSEIDSADRELLQVLNKRMKLIDRVLEHKEACGLPLFDEDREGALIARLIDLGGPGGSDRILVERVLKEIIRYSREVQSRRVQRVRNPHLSKVRTVAFQGTEGAYSWLACRQHFGEEIEARGYGSFPEAIRAVESGNVDVALLPIENVLAGSVYEVYDLLAQTGLHVVGEEVLRIELCLIGLQDIPLSEIRSVLSHPVALQQCRRFLDGLPQGRRVPYIDTAEAVAKVKEDCIPHQVAIASRESAHLHGLRVLQGGIADNPENYTRFWIIARHPVRVDLRIPARTSLLLVTDHREGALVACLAALAAQGVNMTKLESRPLPENPWKYQFHLDVEGNLSEERMMRALDNVRALSRTVRILGCYPRAERETAKEVIDRHLAGIENSANTSRE